ncbi:MAG: lipopolysaccharide assembly protein LapB [Pseudomonadota bacterium]
MIEFLLLLLPVAAASGWWVARRGHAKKEQKHQQDISPAYFQGLNYLLNEQPDKAIDIFIKMLEVDRDTVETHLALGNLFRRRGEVDRAIRIHQNLIARPSLSREQRAQALLELGQDYMRAGLFDRAENLFVELTETKLYNEQALTNLLEIYQREKEWERCLEVAEQLASSNGSNLKMLISHFYCELAQREIKLGNTEKAENYIKKAQAADRNSVRATILQGDMEKRREDCVAAIRSYKKVEQQDAAYIPEILPRLLSCKYSLGRRSELHAYLKSLYARYRNSEVMLVLCDFIIDEEGEESAVNFVLQHLVDYPDLKVLRRLINLNLNREDQHPKETLDVLKHAVEYLISSQPAYQCDHCGFGAKKLHWHCPSCKSWSSIKPLQGLGCHVD